MSLDMIKRKIASIQSTAKTTNAMKLVASAKLKRQRNKLAEIQSYYENYYEVIGLLLSVVKDVDFLTIPNTKKRTLYITINSTMGLAGSYNFNVNRLVNELIKPEDITFTIGKKGNDNMRVTKREHQINKFLNLTDNDMTFAMALAIGKEALELYLSGEVSAIKVVYTKFVNAIVFEPEVIDVLPFNKDEVLKKNNIGLELEHDNIIFQPNKEDIIRMILPSYVAIVLFDALLNSHISENASRRNAMEGATKNARSLAESYKLTYNTLRQGKITSEITEIVAGSDDE